MSGTYGIIVVDPPWAYGRSTGRTRTAEYHYKTLGNSGKEINRHTGAGVEAIIDSVPISEWVGDDAHLYLWVTNPKLPFAFAVMAAWGFVYKTMLTWVKTRRDGEVIGNGMGWFFRGATEHVLFGVKGNFPIPSALREPNVFFATRGQHSEKPDELYELIDRISDARKLDVFARKQRPGWDAWGDEV